MTESQPLSPTALKVWSAFLNNFEWEVTTTELKALAAALRAVVKQGRLGPEHREGTQPDDYEWGWNAALNYVSAIAGEPESSNG